MTADPSIETRAAMLNLLDAHEHGRLDLSPETVRALTSSLAPPAAAVPEAEDGRATKWPASPARPWCCPEPRCIPLHSLQGSDQPLSVPVPGETFLCFGKAPEVEFIYDGVTHVNDVRSCTYTALKGVISYQENADDWRAIKNAYGRALYLLEHPAPLPEGQEGESD